MALEIQRNPMLSYSDGSPTDFQGFFSQELNSLIDTVNCSFSRGYPNEQIMEGNASPPLKAEEEQQREEDEDGPNKYDPQEEGIKKPFITKVSMMFYPGRGSKSEDTFSTVSSHSKIFKLRESSSLLQDSKAQENPRSLLLLLHQKDLEIQGLKSAAQKDPADRLSYILRELVKAKNTGLWKRSTNEEALQKEIDQLNADLEAVKEEHAKEVKLLEDKLTSLNLHIKNLQQIMKNLGVKSDDVTDIESRISLNEGPKLACESFELWSETGQKISADTSNITLRRIPKHTSFVDAFHKFGSGSLSNEEREDIISRLETIADNSKPQTGGNSEESSQESSRADSKLLSELSSQAILPSLKSDLILSESKRTESSSSLPSSLEDKIPGKKSLLAKMNGSHEDSGSAFPVTDLAPTLDPWKLTQLGLSLGQLSEEEICPHLVHTPFLQECKRCQADTSSLRIVNVHRKGKFIRIFNCLLNKEVDLSGYIIQQWVGGYPVSIYHFPKGVVLPAQHHITVWAAGANLAHEPSSFSTTQKFFRAGPECLTTLCDCHGQMVSQYINPHQFTAAAAAYSDNVDLSIDKFPLCDDSAGNDESLYSKISFLPRNSRHFSIDSSPSFKMWCGRSIGNKRKTNGEFKESSSPSEEDYFACQSWKPALEEPVTRKFKTTLDTTIPMVSLIGQNSARSKYGFNYMMYLPSTTDLHLRRPMSQLSRIEAEFWRILGFFMGYKCLSFNIRTY
ncbi:lamin tail domain-containing protein 2 [Python bivittatus]|uniref:Lamin tail domain-containing protein 2 n=1 Tax=Python bivittatus TaxID=176946 RepID=A0A9F5MQM7_PYTBI|nr:lamin tail domain-containing protein 2 [Python bivittatus]